MCKAGRRTKGRCTQGDLMMLGNILYLKQGRVHMGGFRLLLSFSPILTSVKSGWSYNYRGPSDHCDVVVFTLAMS